LFSLIPSNFIVKLTSAKVFLPTVMILFGAINVCTAAVRSAAVSSLSDYSSVYLNQELFQRVSSILASGTDRWSVLWGQLSFTLQMP
jgi:hypothetical protein